MTHLYWMNAVLSRGIDRKHRRTSGIQDRPLVINAIWLMAGIFNSMLFFGEFRFKWSCSGLELLFPLRASQSFHVCNLHKCLLLQDNWHISYKATRKTHTKKHFSFWNSQYFLTPIKTANNKRLSLFIRMCWCTSQYLLQPDKPKCKARAGLLCAYKRICWVCWVILVEKQQFVHKSSTLHLGWTTSYRAPSIHLSHHCICHLSIKEKKINQCQTNCCVIASSQEQEKLNFMKSTNQFSPRDWQELQ